MYWYLILPLSAAIIYATASVLLKRALKEGATMDQTFHFTNLCVTLVFLPLIFFEKEVIDWRMIWQPAIVSGLFFIGNLTTFMAIRKGDVSVVTPLMGTKVVFVGIAVVFLTKTMPSQLIWIAAFLTSVGIFLMGFSEFRKKAGESGLIAIAIVLVSAIFFALQDVFLSYWAGGFGAMTFMVVSMAGLSAFSLIMWVVQGRPTLRMPPSSLKFGLSGGILIGLQALLMGVSLSFFNDATRINVVYASRGLWALAVVAFLGSYLGNDERKNSGKAFRWRIVGSILVTIAVVMAVLDR
ncbi:MAG: EamA family transporter [Verrucomicrobiales bacterium]|nr:EamA family transporter [Verrucomicrobiales bacterium]